jgi:hypothetical protein
VIVGVTGSRLGPSVAQLKWLRSQLREATELHHGASVGVDAAAHRVAIEIGTEAIVVHPPVDLKAADQSTMVDMPGVTVLPRKPYLKCNHDIVDACNVLLALPMGKETQRIGTWATVRYAVKIGRPVRICGPYGERGK